MRSEISEHLKATYIMGTVITTLLAGAITAGSITWQNNAFLSTFIFNVAVPILLLTAAIGASYAFQQMDSIGRYIRSGIEDKINFLFDSEFQGWLKEKRPKTGLLQAWRIMDWEGRVEKTRGTGKPGRRRDITVFSLVFGLPFGVSVTMGELCIFLSEGWLSTPCGVRWFLGFIPFIILCFGVCGCMWVGKSGVSE